MAVTYGFYDSLNHDRLYNAQQMSAIFDGIINDGVFMSVGNQFHTVAGTGMQVIVKSGRAWFDSTWTLNDAEYPLSIDAADVLLTRIDAVVLEVNSEVATRANTIKVVKGTPSSTPAKPTLTNTATIHQHALAYVTVAKNITAITNSMIEIVVGKTETPYVTAILQTTDITDLYNQWEDYFQTWFDTVRGTLDGDVALNLQNQITSLRRETLKNTTPPIIGLPASATPDDMFQALAKTGELHVWRKTVTNQQAGYDLSDVKTNGTLASGEKGYTHVALSSGSSVLVSSDGYVTIDNPNNQDFYAAQSSGWPSLSGKFIKVNNYAGDGSGSLSSANSEFQVGTILYIPSGGNIAHNGSGRIYLTKYQIVTGHGARTTTTYPVSTNPNAYQEGSDGKPAGYTLGEVENNVQILSGGDNWPTTLYYADSVDVDNEGHLSLQSPNQYTFTTSSQYQNVSTLAVGRFIKIVPEPRSGFLFRDGIWFVPSDATVTVSNYKIYASKIQKVTGYAAIPAGTTIEYLGKLGDKAMVQVVSYVGTGTYGADNPNSLTFDFVPKVVMIRCGRDIIIFDAIYGMRKVVTDFSSGDHVTVKWSKKTLSWYSDYSVSCQMNDAGDKYYAIAIG